MNPQWIAFVKSNHDDLQWLEENGYLPKDVVELVHKAEGEK